MESGGVRPASFRFADVCAGNQGLILLVPDAAASSVRDELEVKSHIIPAGALSSFGILSSWVEEFMNGRPITGELQCHQPQRWYW